ncbi:MAG: class I SAM-dependent methyltransferase [Bacteroidota bacterium]|nr:class I SAM-dependent methyltransferase [Bacteroidota bacterium]
MSRLKIPYKYLIYRIKAVDEHGVHSPFVFDLLNAVVYNKADFYSYSAIEGLRNELLGSEKKVHCIEMGAGSYKGQTKVRRVSDIARSSVKPAKYSQLLFRLVNYFQPANVLELGTSLGISTAYMAMANTSASVTTMEGCPELATIAKQNFSKEGIKNINIITGNFDDKLPEFLSRNPSLDFVFFDGNHRKQPTLDYFHQCLKNSHAQSVFIFDDINWSDEMQEAWSEIKAHEKVTVTIDLFFMGLVFFRKEQVKQHFLIKF